MIEKELRIGNYVMSALKAKNGAFMKVSVLDARNGNVFADSIEDNNTEYNTNIIGIELNDDLIYAFGFKKTNGYGFNVLGTWLTKEDGVYWYLLNGRYIELGYVHQLQNLYFALTGIELTLKTK